MVTILAFLWNVKIRKNKSCKYAHVHLLLLFLHEEMAVMWKFCDLVDQEKDGRRVKMQHVA